MTLRLYSHVGPIFNGELLVSGGPVTLGTPCWGMAHLVRRRRACSSRSGCFIPISMVSLPTIHSITCFPLFLPLKCQLWMSSLHPEVTELKQCLRRGADWQDTKQGRGGKCRGREEERRERRWKQLGWIKREARPASGEKPGLGKRVLKKKGCHQVFQQRTELEFCPIFSMSTLEGTLHKETSSYQPPFSASPLTRSGRHINHSGCPSAFLSSGLLPMVRKAADRQMPDTWLLGSWVVTGKRSYFSLRTF